jgi:hypothetical protein
LANRVSNSSHKVEPLCLARPRTQALQAQALLNRSRVSLAAVRRVHRQVPSETLQQARNNRKLGVCSEVLQQHNHNSQVVCLVVRQVRSSNRKSIACLGALQARSSNHRAAACLEAPQTRSSNHKPVACLEALQAHSNHRRVAYLEARQARSSNHKPVICLGVLVNRSNSRKPSDRHSDRSLAAGLSNPSCSNREFPQSLITTLVNVILVGAFFDVP